MKYMYGMSNLFLLYLLVEIEHEDITESDKEVDNEDITDWGRAAYMAGLSSDTEKVDESSEPT